jgi:hypothetical protein
MLKARGREGQEGRQVTRRFIGKRQRGEEVEGRNKKSHPQIEDKSRSERT